MAEFGSCTGQNFADMLHELRLAQMLHELRGLEAAPRIAEGLAWRSMSPSDATRSTLTGNCMLSRLVAFDTNVYMNNNHNCKDAKVIMQVLHACGLISPSIAILVPIVVMSELSSLATSKNSSVSQLAAAGLKVLQSVLASNVAHMQLPAELPEGCWAHKRGDDGILDCLRHFKEAGYHVLLCTRDKQLICRSQAQGIEAFTPDLLSRRPEYPLRVSITPIPPGKRKSLCVARARAAALSAEGAAIAAAQHACVAKQLAGFAWPGAVPGSHCCSAW